MLNLVSVATNLVVVPVDPPHLRHCIPAICACVALALVLAPTCAHAEIDYAGSKEIVGWLGYNVLAADSELGNGFLRDDVPKSFVALGFRGAYNLAELVGVEGAFKLTPSSLGSGKTASSPACGSGFLRILCGQVTASCAALRGWARAVRPCRSTMWAPPANQDLCSKTPTSRRTLA